MGFLIGAALVAATVYFWWRRWIIARVAVFGFLGVLFIVCIGHSLDHDPQLSIAAIAAAIVAAWAIAGIPTYLERHRVRVMAFQHPAMRLTLSPED